MNFVDPGATRKPIKTIAFERIRLPRIGDSEAMITIQVPHDPFWFEMVFTTQMKDLFDYFRWRLVGATVWGRALVDKPCLTLFAIGMAQAIKAGPPNT